MEDRELDPVRDPGRWESIVAKVMLGSRPELERLRAEASPSAAIAAWWRTVTAGAGALASAAVLALLMVTPAVDGAGPEEEVPVVAAAISSQTVAAWLLADEMPTAEELLAAYEEGAQ